MPEYIDGAGGSSAKVIDFNFAKRQDDHGSGTDRPDGDEIRQAVTGRAHDFVMWMYPCAVVHKSGRYAVIGDIYGQPGESLQIVLTGPKAGCWNDYASEPDGGRDLVSLFMASNDYSRTDFPEALEIINSEFLGRAKPDKRKPTITAKFTERAKAHEGKPRPDINDRPLPSESYYYRDVSGGIIAVVRRYEYEETDPKTGKPKKTFSVWDARESKAQAPTPRPLYRLDKIAACNELVFVEGERKADALASVGIEATSAMGGAGTDFSKIDWSPIAGKRIIIWPDRDRTGWEYSERLVAHLAGMKCKVARVWPPDTKPEKWDAYDCVIEGGDPQVLIAAAVDYVAASLIAMPYNWKEPETISPRDWLYDHRVIRKFATATIAPGGLGKSSLEITEMLAMVSGKALLGINLAGQLLRVWYWNLEDPREETERRIQAAAKQYGLKPDDIDDRLFFNCGREQPLVIAETLRNGAVICHPVVDALVAQLIERKIDVLIIDPFVSSHHVVENDNNAMDMVVKEWGHVADLGNCAVELVHHVRKGEQEVTAESARGGGAFIDGCRMVRVCNRMTEDEAKKAGVDNRRLYFRAFNDKANLAPPVETSNWFKLVSVDLCNGPLGPSVGGGDHIGVVVKWKWPDHTADVTSNDFDSVAMVIRAGKWRADVQAKNWVGKAVAEGLGLDLKNTADRAKVTSLIKYWLACGSLIEVEGVDERRKPKMFIVVKEDE